MPSLRCHDCGITYSASTSSVVGSCKHCHAARHTAKRVKKELRAEFLNETVEKKLKSLIPTRFDRKDVV